MISPTPITLSFVDFGFHLFKLQALLEQYVRHIVDQFGLTITDTKVLMILGYSPGVHFSYLEKEVPATDVDIAQTLVKLRKIGVIRKEKKGHTRFPTYYLTESGSELNTLIMEQLNAEVETMLDKAEPGQLLTTTQLVNRLHARLQEEEY
ncbi:MAG: MarR family winged helix-turn-helix transcriptional regulator [Bacteroidota bacterium]